VFLFDLGPGDQVEILKCSANPNNLVALNAWNFRLRDWGDAMNMNVNPKFVGKLNFGVLLIWSFFSFLILILVLGENLFAKGFEKDQAISGNCEMNRLKFSADRILPVPQRGSKIVWGGNATDGEFVLNPPFSSQFLNAAQIAKSRGLKVFAYLEGPCGDTDGVDDGERARCRKLHRAYNSQYAPGTPDTDLERWKPFTFAQMRLARQYGVEFCEIDNLNNNVDVPLLDILEEIKQRYDQGEIYCQLVLKNISVSELDSIRGHFGKLESTDFIASFHIFEDRNLQQKKALDAAMLRLLGPGAVTIISTNTNAYGSAFTDDSFSACGGAH